MEEEELKKCPVCGRQGMPRCIFYDQCDARVRHLQAETICWLEPALCDLYKKRIKSIIDGTPKPNPSSRRDFK